MSWAAACESGRGGELLLPRSPPRNRLPDALSLDWHAQDAHSDRGRSFGSRPGARARRIVERERGQEARFLAAPPGEPLAPEDEERLREIRRHAPGAYIDGPRAHNSGGWYMFVGGLPGEAWVMEYGEGPADAAARALLRAEQVLDREGP